MKYLFLLIGLLLVSCNAEVKRVEGGSSMPFIEVEDVMRNLAQGGDSIGYTLSDCNLLLSDSLQGDLIIDLENSYQDIEDLINNPDKKFEERRPLNKSKLQTPILKHENKVLVKWGNLYEGFSVDYAYAFELVKPKKMTITLIYKVHSDFVYTPLQPVIKEEDSTVITIPEFDKKLLEEFFQQNICYPKAAMKDSIRGVVFVSFWVETDLTKSDFRISRSSISESFDKEISKKFDEEALRVARFIPFRKPAFQYGKPIRYEMTMPISFRLPAK